MFHHNEHFEIWNKIHVRLKRSDYTGAVSVWNESLPDLARHYDEVRMLYYVGRFGAREPYAQICATLAHLRNNPPEILNYRLTIFRYAVERSTMTDQVIKDWMLEDLSNALGMRLLDIELANPVMPESLAVLIRKANPPTPRDG